jgi:hypothetical protein
MGVVVMDGDRQLRNSNMYRDTMVVMDGCEKAAARCCDGLARENCGGGAVLLLLGDGRSETAACMGTRWW